MSGNDILKNCRKSFKGYMRKSYIKVSVFAEIGDLNLEGGVIFGGGVFGLVTGGLPQPLIREGRYRKLYWEGGWRGYWSVGLAHLGYLITANL